MKKIIFILLLLPFISQAQIKISEMTTTTNPTGAYIPVARNGANYKIIADSLMNKKVDSVTVSNDTVYYWKNAGTRYIAGVINGGVTSVFARTGAVTAAEADYQSYYPRISQSYANPSWITSLPWSKITSAPTTLSGYGITDPVVVTSGSYSNPAWITSLAFSKISGITGTPNGTKFLRDDGSWQAIATGITINSTSITSGTAGKLLYQNSSNQVGEGAVYWDNTNLGLSINTSSVTNPFTSATDNLVVRGASGAGYWAVRDDPGGGVTEYLGNDGTGNRVLLNYNGTRYAIGFNGTDRFHFYPGGLFIGVSPSDPGAGNLFLEGTIKTGAPTGGAGAWKLGIANSVSPTSPNRTLTVEIGGTTYYIAAKTTND